MKEYRTDEQFAEIVDSFQNGNWTQAAKECVEYGFWANDLLNAFRRTIEPASDDEYNFETACDLVLLAEMAAEERYKEK